MSFKDLGNKDAAPHVDTPQQAEARAQAVAHLKAKADAKAARSAAQAAGKDQKPAANDPAQTGRPSK